jgi:hypothetical protein
MADLKPQSPEWWLQKQLRGLEARQPHMQLMDDYYCGNHPLPFLTKTHRAKMTDEFRQLLNDSQSNFMGLIVDVVEERLRVDGFRLSAQTDPTADKRTWEIWQENQMDAESQSAFVEALVKGVSYLSVWSDKPGETPTIAVEDPLQTIVSYVPGSNYRKRAAALKVWTDENTGTRRANVYLPEGIYKFEEKDEPQADKSTLSYTNAPAEAVERASWEQLPDAAGFAANPLRVVPIIPLRNRPRILDEGRSELADIFHVQNQINGFLFLLALAGYFGAHKQRWAVGLKIMEDENKRPVEPFDVDVGKLWVATAGADGQEVKFGEFSQTELSGYIKAIEQKILHIAVTTRTPRHYLIEQGQSPSGDAIRSAESGLVKKVERKQRPFGEGLEEALRLARRFDGDGESPPDSEIVWGDPATESPGVVTDAILKQFAGGLIPWEAALEKLGYSQTEIQRWSAMRLSDALLQGIANPAPPAPDTVRPPIVRE